MIVSTEPPAVGKAGVLVGLAVVVRVLGFGHFRHLGDAYFGWADDIDAAAVVKSGGKELPIELRRIGNRLGAEDIATAKHDEERAVGSEINRADFRRGSGGEFDIFNLITVLELGGKKRLSRQDAKNAKF